MSKPGRNDPCPCGSGKKYKHCHLGKSDDVWSQPAPAPEPEPMASFYPPGFLPTAPAAALEQYDEGWEEEFDFQPLEEAWEIVEDAWEETDPKKRAKLAKQAIKHCPDCPGGYYVLATLEQKPEERIKLWQRTVEAAEAALAPDTLAQLVLHEWLDPEIDYAMFAMLNHALALLELERTDEGVAMLRQLLELDPRDQVIARPLLMLQLMALEDLDAAAELERGTPFMHMQDPTWAFARALMKFQREGDSLFARRALASAIMMHPTHAALLDEGFDLAEEGEEFGEGADETELDLLDDEAFLDEMALQLDDPEGAMNPFSGVAMVYAVGLHSLLWQSTEGADAWFRSVLQAGPPTRFDNRQLGDGPVFYLSGSEQDDYRRCPNCHKATTFRPTTLVMALEDGPIVALNAKSRRCPECDYLLVDYNELTRVIREGRHSQEGRDFMPLGYIPESEPRDHPDVDWLLAQMRPFRRIEDADANRVEWPTQEENLREIEALLESSGLAELIGPHET